jgi:hypothetical protein
MWLPARVPTTDAGINPSICRARTGARLYAPDELACGVVEGDLLLIDPRCSVVVAVVVGDVDCARIAGGVQGDLDVELVVGGRVTLCCKRSARCQLQIMVSTCERLRVSNGYTAGHLALVGVANAHVVG